MRLCVGGLPAGLNSALLLFLALGFVGQLLDARRVELDKGDGGGLPDEVDESGVAEDEGQEEGAPELDENGGAFDIIERLGDTGLVLQWPSADVLAALGQVAGVSIGPDGSLYLFQRGERQWTAGTFNKDNTYSGDHSSPIREDAIWQFSSSLDDNGVKQGIGKNRFFMPHGITVDHENNVWVTDVALHQVMKFAPGKSDPALTLGIAFEPGQDVQHFCKPTHVAVAKNGDFFVADGYCNSRILKFNKAGQLMHSWGIPDNGDEVLRADELSIPHALALLEERDELCVADREHGRVQCYNAGLKNKTQIGKPTASINAAKLGPTFGIAYNSQKKILAILGGARDEITRSDIGFYHVEKKAFVEKFNYPSEEGFGDGHSLAFSADGRRLLVGSLTNICPFESELCMDPRINRNVWLFQ